MIVSKLGRFCLEIGKKIEAISLFQIVQDMIVRENKNPASDGRPSSTALLDNLLETTNEDKTTVENDDLTITNLMN